VHPCLEVLALVNLAECALKVRVGFGGKAAVVSVNNPVAIRQRRQSHAGMQWSHWGGVEARHLADGFHHPPALSHHLAHFETRSRSSRRRLRRFRAWDVAPRRGWACRHPRIADLSDFDIVRVECPPEADVSTWRVMLSGSTVRGVHRSILRPLPQ
jgi:hypothetical protein